MDEYKVYPIGEVHMDEEGFFIDLDPSYRPALQALEGFSHINVLWWFSHCDMKELRCMLEAPKPYRQSPDVMGIFATRSPVRPNPIALSAAEVIHIDEERGHIQIAYIDAEDGSPVLDIKPYTPSLDRIENPGLPGWCRHWPRSVEDSADFNWEDEFNF